MPANVKGWFVSVKAGLRAGNCFSKRRNDGDKESQLSGPATPVLAPAVPVPAPEAPQPEPYVLPRALPLIVLQNGTVATLDSAPHEFANWNDYVHLCYAGPYVSIGFERPDGRIEAVVSMPKKLLTDNSNMMATQLRNNDALEFDRNLISPAVFIALKNILEAGGTNFVLAGNFTGNYHLYVAVFAMAKRMGLDCVQRWVKYWFLVQVQTLAGNWRRHWENAHNLAYFVRQFEVNPPVLHAVDPGVNEVLRLVDMAEAAQSLYHLPEQFRVVGPLGIIRLIANACPRRLLREAWPFLPQEVQDQLVQAVVV